MSGTPVLLPYQQALIRAIDAHRVVVAEKSRRIGYTWGVAAKAALVASATKQAGGSDAFYIGYNREMTREFIDTAAMWLRAYAQVAVEVSEFVFRDQDGDDSRDIQAFRIQCASGFEILALCSRPRSLRGKQGFVVIDEAAFHDELEELLKAAFALLIWGGRVVIISTHDGDDNAFNALVQEVRAGKRPYALLRVTFDEALEQGLYRRICLVQGIEWTAESEAAWAKEIRDFYGDAADEELDCIPRKSGGKYLSRVLLEARAVDVPVLRWQVADDWVDGSDQARSAECAEWIKQHLTPLLDGLPGAARSFVGEDFGRSGDLTVYWPLLVGNDLRRSTPFTIELRNIPFREQEQILFALCDKLPRFCGAALDARGNGQYLAEVARQRYGKQTIAQVMLTEQWYRENMPRMKAALEDGKMDLPRDAQTVDDFRALEVVRGVPRVGERTGKGAVQRHGDAAVAGCLAWFASETLEGGAIGDWAVAGKNVAAEAFGGFEERGDAWNN